MEFYCKQNPVTFLLIRLSMFVLHLKLLPFVHLIDILPFTFILDKTPSDIGLHRVAMKIGSCDLLAVELGIPLAHIDSLPDSPLKGLRTLAYWRNGRCHGSFPTTWGFLLEKVEGVCGRTVADELRETLSRDPACVNPPPLHAR